MRVLRALLVAASLASLAGTASADSFFDIFIDGLQETPPNASPASGTGTAVLNEGTNQLTLHYEFSGLLGSQTAAHLHTAPPGTAGPVTIGLPLGSPVDRVLDLTDQQESDLLNGLIYVNIHSTVFPGGEIRGQLHLIPEPASLALLALGGLLALRRR